MGDHYLTMAEIEAKYPNEWVLLDRPKVNKRTLEVYGGWVVCHAPDRGEFDALMLAAPPMKVGAIRYTGEFDLDGVVFPHHG